jgi:hypothetical protein
MRGTVEAIVKRRQSETSPSILHAFVLQRVDGLCQLSQSKWLNGVLSTLEVDDCALGNCGLARKTSGRKLHRLCSDFV